MNLGPGDIVWTVPNTFVASANCALYCGAQIDFVDIDPNTSNISVQALETKLKASKKKRKLPKILIPVHFTGEPCDMQPIKELSEVYGFKIIEDASHAIGGKYGDTNIGSSFYSDITVFSFHPVKIITSGEGGAALTNNKKLDQKMKLLRSHGITRDKSLMEHPNENGWYYEQIDLGFNYRMTDIHAALGISQIQRLKEYVSKRNEIADFYDREFLNTSIVTPVRNPNNLSAAHLYVVQVEESFHSTIFRQLRERRIGVNLHYIPVHTQPYYRKLGFNWGDYPNAEGYYKRAISLPIYPTLEKAKQDFVVEQLKLMSCE